MRRCLRNTAENQKKFVFPKQQILMNISSTVVAQNIGNGDNGDGNTEYHGMLNDMNISVTSQTLHAGDKSSINVSGKEYSKNMRGFNIVVVDNTTGEVIDSVSFDTHVPEFTCTR